MKGKELAEKRRREEEREARLESGGGYVVSGKGREGGQLQQGMQQGMQQGSGEAEQYSEGQFEEELMATQRYAVGVGSGGTSSTPHGTTELEQLAGYGAGEEGGEGEAYGELEDELQQQLDGLQIHRWEGYK
jgi:hypothetical protein